MPSTKNYTATIGSVTSLLEAVASLDQKPGEIVMFRGVKRADWDNEAAIFRDPPALMPYERDIVRELPSIHPTEFEHDATMFDRLVRMQHYGLPTRLLDVTANPLIALYFAVAKEGDNGQDGYVTVFHIPADRRKYYDSDAVSCIANLANMSDDEKADISSHLSTTRSLFNKLNSVDRLLQFIRSEKPYFRSNIDPGDLARPFYVRPKMNNRRIIAQAGSFIIYGLKAQRDVPYQRNIRVKRWAVPNSLKADILSELSNLGINVSTLFPEIDKAAAYVVSRFSKAP